MVFYFLRRLYSNCHSPFGSERPLLHKSLLVLPRVNLTLCSTNSCILTVSVLQLVKFHGCVCTACVRQIKGLRAEKVRLNPLRGKARSQYPFFFPQFLMLKQNVYSVSLRTKSQEP